LLHNIWHSLKSWGLKDLLRWPSTVQVSDLGRIRAAIPQQAPRHAELAAKRDALAGHPAYAEGVRRIASRLGRARQRGIREDLLEAGGTRVEFFTLKRGEDE
jgi:alpha-D-ribose 1-methylphosphonate 5-triphosphate synthase subunit PhnG